jgi:hypothetical protein
VEGHLANPRAIPLDILEAKQRDLASRLAAAHQELAHAEGDLAKAEKGLRTARLLLHDASSAWDQADQHVRRQWNRTFFDRLYIGPDGVDRADLSELYEAILTEDLEKDLATIERNPELLRSGFDSRPFSGDGGNRTHVRGRVKGGVYERIRRSDLAPDSPRRRGCREPAP